MKKSIVYTIIPLCLAVLFMSHRCSKVTNIPEYNDDNALTETEMETKVTYTFNGDFNDLWNKVDSLEKQGLYQSALDVVQVIFDAAQKEENSPEVVKAVIHKMKYNSYIKEDDYIIAIDELSKLAAKEEFPLKNIIHSITGEIYWRYYAQNRWQFMNRSTTVNFENNDIRTWDLKHLSSKVNENYLLSLANEQQLQSITIESFKSILINTSEIEKFQPTLYDFLAHRALQHFQNSETSLTRPENKFSVNGKSYFGTTDEFLTISTDSEDTLSHQLYAVKILQGLAKFHKNDSNPTAQINNDIIRLFYAKNNCKDELKDDWYIGALNKLAQKHEKNEGFAEVSYHIAQFYSSKGDEYSKENPDNRWEKKKALDICKTAIAAYPNSYGAKQCASLGSSIQEKNLSFTSEIAHYPGKKGKMLFNYKNIDSVYFRIIKADWDAFQKDYNTDEERVADMLKHKSVKEWSNKIIDPQDYQNHSTEIVIPENEVGHYFILASHSKDFNLTKNNITTGSFWVTTMGYTYRTNNDGTVSVNVTDRETGKVLPNVKASIITQKYNYTSRKYEYKTEDTYTTNNLGSFSVGFKTDYRNFNIALKNGNDEFNSLSQLYQYNRNQQVKSYVTTNFYTDRAIYRPGQTIYFKGIKIKHLDNNHSIVANEKTTVTFFDVNYQKIASVDVTTNEYGTFSGSFVAPSSGLNGQMSLQEKDGTSYIRVEEYKRPKFEVKMEPVLGSFKLGQEITVTGNAKAYAGSVIDGANVQFRITRSSYYPSWIYYRWGYYPPSRATVEIKNGVVTSDENGKFTVKFNANEDPSIDKKYSPNYNYQITVDVTDVSGETRSASQSIFVGYTSMNLNLGIASRIDKADQQVYTISTTNLNGQKVNAKGKVVVTQLIEPTGVFRSSFWAAPDLPTIPTEEYKKLFPNDAVDSELDVSKFKKGSQVISRNFDTAKEDTILLKEFKTLKVGRYLVETTALDSFGVEVKDIHYITLNDQKSATISSNDLFFAEQLTSMREPGEKAQFIISSAANDVSVMYEIERKGKITHTEFITLNASQKMIELPILESDRGNVTVHFSTTKFGRTFTNSFTVYVPFSNKELEVSFETFRDKLLPGSKEEWKLRIKGPNGEKVAAELLVAMYDASLDAFAANSFYLYPYQSYYSSGSRQQSSFTSASGQNHHFNWNTYLPLPHREYPSLNWYGGYYGDYYGGYADFEDRSDQLRDMAEVSISSRKENKSRSKIAESEGIPAPAPSVAANGALMQGGDAAAYQWSADEAAPPKENQNLGEITGRTNLNETAFFYPQLETDANGDVIIKFTIPEALTKWKLLGLAHTKDLKIGNIQKEVVTQKELMVQPNAPRFMREGDNMTFSAKVSNLSEEDLDGSAQLFLFDAATMQPVDQQFNNTNAVQQFSVKKGLSTPLTWDIKVPEGIGAITYRVAAKAKNHTDGEEMSLPILSNRMLVTESIPLPSKGIGTKEFNFTKLIESGSSSTIKHHKVTLEYTSNPAWYAIQAMPYMMEYPYECAEQTFTRYYSNAIASNIVNSSPKIKQVFESWKQSSPDAFLSNLQKNQELKSLMLEETPWVLDAQNESERKKRVGLLFDLNKMDNELNQNIKKLEKMQVSNGGWPWFPGMPESRYITQHIVTGMGHLDNLGVKNVREDKSVWNMVKKGVDYLDERLVEDFNWVKSHYSNYKTEQHISELQVQYLYARSYFKDLPMDEKTKEAFNYYAEQSAKYWTKFNIYNEGMIALYAKRYDQPALATSVMKSLKERALKNDELGMYWKDNIGGYYWYQAPIETQALLIEAFDEVTDDQETVEELKVWLLKQKQTTDWKTTKATAEACYALLLRGTAILENTEQVEISINGKVLDPKSLGTPVEAGTGYFKTSWSGNEITPDLGKIAVTRKTNGVSWGSMYWQYFEDLDKITSHETPLKLNKKIFLVKNTSSGPVIEPISETTKLKAGDKVRVRIELRTDRNMEYVHMKDMRAAGFEPVNVLSSYKYQGGLGYYESTKDAATHFFFDYMAKGTYVFEYDVRVSHAGNFSNGVATIQCMYAPEFTSHSEGVRVTVGK